VENGHKDMVDSEAKTESFLADFRRRYAGNILDFLLAFRLGALGLKKFVKFGSLLLLSNAIFLMIEKLFSMKRITKIQIFFFI
jgi:hypothetical protein